MPASTDVVKVAMLAGAFMTAAVVPLRPIEEAIWTEAVLHGLSHAVPSKCGVPKWPGLQTLGGGGGGGRRRMAVCEREVCLFHLDLPG